jgi:hypothetical protein
MQEKSLIIVYGIGTWPLAGTFSISFSVFVLELHFQGDSVAILLLVQKVKKMKKARCNDDHEDDNDNLLVNCYFFTIASN